MSFQKSGNFARNDDGTPTRPTQLDNGIDSIFERLDIAAALPEPRQATITNAPASTQDALDVLLSALPTSVVESIESQYSLNFPDEPTSRRPTATPRPTTSHSRTKTSTRTTSSSRKTSSTSSSFTSTSSSTFSTSTITSSPTSSIPSATSTPAPVASDSDSDSGLSTGAIAGIAVGATAGVVLILMAALFLLRRKRQNRAPFGPRNSVRSRDSRRAYPEVAWLYDPNPTPPRSSSIRHQRQESATSLIPRQPEPAARDMSQVNTNNSSTVYQPYRPESPLLPAQIPLARDIPPGEVSPNSSPRNSSSSPSSRYSPSRASRSTHMQSVRYSAIGSSMMNQTSGRTPSIQSIRESFMDDSGVSDNRKQMPSISEGEGHHQARRQSQ